MFVLDSSALLAFLYGDPGHERIAELLATAGDRTALRLHRIHLGEVYYLFYRKGGETLAEEMLADVRQLPIILEDRVSPALMHEAGRLKALIPTLICRCVRGRPGENATRDACLRGSPGVWAGGDGKRGSGLLGKVARSIVVG